MISKAARHTKKYFLYLISNWRFKIHENRGRLVLSQPRLVSDWSNTKQSHDIGDVEDD